MQKNFEGWGLKKQDIHEGGKAPFYHEREAWWCSMGTNIGSEQDGTGKNFDRPVVILRAFNKHAFLAVALTGKERSGKFHFFLGKLENRDASAILSQVRIFDSKRLIRKIGTLDESTFKKLKEACKNILFP